MALGRSENGASTALAEINLAKNLATWYVLLYTLLTNALPGTGGKVLLVNYMGIICPFSITWKVHNEQPER